MLWVWLAQALARQLLLSFLCWKGIIMRTVLAVPSSTCAKTAVTLEGTRTNLNEAANILLLLTLQSQASNAGSCGSSLLHASCALQQFSLRICKALH